MKNKKYFFVISCFFLTQVDKLLTAPHNILGRSVHTIEKNTEALVVASKEISLEKIADKTKYIVMSREQN
jgi:hypothetical protein